MTRALALLAVVIGAGMTSVAADGRQQTSPDPLARLRAYVVAYGAELPSLVAEELYVQNHVFADRVEKRTTKADLLMARLPGNGGWMTFATSSKWISVPFAIAKIDF